LLLPFHPYRSDSKLLSLSSDAGFVQRAESLVDAVKRNDFVTYCDTQIKGASPANYSLSFFGSYYYINEAFSV
jgi:hypothetical protein